VTRSEIEELLRGMPLTSGAGAMLDTLKSSAGATFVIVSDANDKFIRVPLDNAGLLHHFDKVLKARPKLACFHEIFWGGQHPLVPFLLRSPPFF
jgi:phosphoglycolate phosphatase-like HAD superfamily hydrolase